jgi:GNAT superfamily N-acetyltransferase
MTEEVTVRVASTPDLESLYALYLELETPHPAVTRDRLKEVFSRLSLYPDYKVYLAEYNGRVVGTFALLIADTLGDRCAPEGIVEDVVVSKDARGGGIGRRMMEFAMDRCREAGCYKMVLSSNVRREDAHRFYESLGFEKHGYSFRVMFD